MESEHLDLSHEFPEYQEKIHQLKLSDNHFKRRFEEYGAVCKAIYRSEKRIDLLSETEEGNLRKQRLSLKEELYSILRS